MAVATECRRGVTGRPVVRGRPVATVHREVTGRPVATGRLEAMARPVATGRLEVMARLEVRVGRQAVQRSRSLGVQKRWRYTP